MDLFTDFDDIWKGYSKEDEFIARDLIILNLLMSKGIVTQEEINKAYEELPDMVMEVKKAREKTLKEKYDELMEKYKKEEEKNNDISE